MSNITPLYNRLIFGPTGPTGPAGGGGSGTGPTGPTGFLDLNGTIWGQAINWNNNTNSWQITGNGPLAFGNNAGQTNQGANAIAIGVQSGQTNQGANAIAIGVQSGQTNQRNNAIAIGIQAGQIQQGTNTIAIGFNAGQNQQGSNSIAIGFLAGLDLQSLNAIAIGSLCGENNQRNNAVAIGNQCGVLNQGTNAVAIGSLAGQTNQGSGAISIGREAGRTGQATNAIAIGSLAGQTGQGTNAIAIGMDAGNTSQRENSIAIGMDAGFLNQGTNSIAIGAFAGITNQHQNSIILNATGSPLNSQTQNGFYISPIRNSNQINLLVYDTSNSEITYSNNYFDNSGNLDLSCNNIIDVSGVFFCDGTYIGTGNSFDISANQQLDITCNNNIIIDPSNTLFIDGTLDMSGNNIICNKVITQGQNGFSGKIACFTCERANNTTNGLAWGNGGSSTFGIPQPASGKIIALSASIGGTSTTSLTRVTLDIYKNGSSAQLFTDYFIIGGASTKYTVNLNITFVAGDSLNIFQTFVGGNAYGTTNVLVVTFWVEYD
jgi:hypothetical protein